VHAFVNDLERPIGTYLYGRRMYEVMAAWETLGTNGSSPAVEEYAGIWRAADKIVFSRTLDKVSSSRTRLEREFDPDVVRRMKAEAHGDMSIGGPTLASRALLAGLVDEIRLFLTPIVVGGGARSLPVDIPVRLRLLDERRFRSGVVHLGYRAL
jgi:dihydrofolate reductase